MQAPDFSVLPVVRNRVKTTISHHDQFASRGGAPRCSAVFPAGRYRAMHFDIAAIFAAEEINPDFIRTECGLSHKAEFVAVCGNSLR